MTDSEAYGYDTDPFPLILDAHIHGHITDDERDQLLAWAYPNIGDDSPDYIRPKGQSHAQQWMTIAMRRAADQLDELLDRADGDTISKAAVRGFAAKLRRGA